MSNLWTNSEPFYQQILSEKQIHPKKNFEISSFTVEGEIVDSNVSETSKQISVIRMPCESTTENLFPSFCITLKQLTCTSTRELLNLRSKRLIIWNNPFFHTVTRVMRRNSTYCKLTKKWSPKGRDFKKDIEEEGAVFIVDNLLRISAFLTRNTFDVTLWI